MTLRRLTANRVHPLIHQSEVVVAGAFAFTSGTLADDGASGIAPEARGHPAYPYLASEIKLQARYLFAKLGRALEAAGTSLDHVLKGHVFLTDIADLTAFDEVWREVFHRPITKTTVGAGELWAAGARVSVDLIAAMPEAAIEVRGANAGPPPPFTAKVEAIRAGDLIFTAGQLAHDGRTGVPPEARRDAREPSAGSDIARQTLYALRNLGASLEAAGGRAAAVAKGQVYLAHPSLAGGFDAAWSGAFETPPARTVVATGLLVPGCLLEIDLTGYVARPGLQAGPVGGERPARAFRVGELVFVSGRSAVDATGSVPPEASVQAAFPVYGSDIKLQTRYVLERLAEDLAAAGSSLDRVAKATVFLADLKRFAAFEEVWRDHFATPPARTVVCAPGLTRPGALVEIDLIATVG